MSFLKIIIISPLTQNSHHLVILDDLQWPRHHETQAVHALSSVVDQVTGGAVDGLELHGQSSEAAVAGQTERWMLFENLPVEMDADVRPHVLWTNLQHLETEDRRGTDGGVGPRMESRFPFLFSPLRRSWPDRLQGFYHKGDNWFLRKYLRVRHLGTNYDQTWFNYAAP